MTDTDDEGMEFLEELRLEFISDFLVEDNKACWMDLFCKVKQAHCKYKADRRTLNSPKPPVSLGVFALKMFRIHPPLREYVHRAIDLKEEFLRFNDTLPTSGAIILNPPMTKVLLVLSSGKIRSWGFPKGKVEEGEAYLDAAIREVQKEIGFDISCNVDVSNPLINEHRGKRVEYFFVRGVDEAINFRLETGEENWIRWFRIADLPTSPDDAERLRPCLMQRPGPARRRETRVVTFSKYGLAPYIKDILTYVTRRQ